MEEEAYLGENKEENPDGSSIYSELAIEQLIEDDELTAWEEGSWQATLMRKNIQDHFYLFY